jgi:hypothetical protein
VSRGLGRSTQEIIEAAQGVLSQYQPGRMTLRQVFYRLVSNQTIDNTQKAYLRLGRCLVTARKAGMVPWDWLEDRTRRPREVPAWPNVEAFLSTVKRSYRRDVWSSQPRQIEAWLEKDTLSGIFEDALREFQVTLNVSRGFDGWSSIYEASRRLGDDDLVLYFSDFDPSGEDMCRSLRERLAHFGCRPAVQKVALTIEDVERFELPPNPCKATDLRRGKHIARYGDISVELDALPPEVLKEKIRSAVVGNIDLNALEQTMLMEKSDNARLAEMIARVS